MVPVGVEEQEVTIIWVLDGAGWCGGARSNRHLGVRWCRLVMEWYEVEL